MDQQKMLNAGFDKVFGKPEETCVHQWKSQRMGGDPAEYDSDEWVTFCDLCGKEKDDDL